MTAFNNTAEITPKKMFCKGRRMKPNNPTTIIDSSEKTTISIVKINQKLSNRIVPTTHLPEIIHAIPKKPKNPAIISITIRYSGSIFLLEFMYIPKIKQLN